MCEKSHSYFSDESWNAYEEAQAKAGYAWPENARLMLDIEIQKILELAKLSSRNMDGQRLTPPSDLEKAVNAIRNSATSLMVRVHHFYFVDKEKRLKNTKRDLHDHAKGLAKKLENFAKNYHEDISVIHEDYKAFINNLKKMAESPETVENRALDKIYSVCRWLCELDQIDPAAKLQVNEQRELKAIKRIIICAADSSSFCGKRVSVSDMPVTATLPGPFSRNLWLLLQSNYELCKKLKKIDRIKALDNVKSWNNYVRNVIKDYNRSK